MVLPIHNQVLANNIHINMKNKYKHTQNNLILPYVK